MSDSKAIWLAYLTLIIQYRILAGLSADMTAIFTKHYSIYLLQVYLQMHEILQIGR